MAKKKRLTVDEIGKRYETFIKGKELNDNGKELFEKAIKNTLPKVTKKPPDTK